MSKVCTVCGGEIDYGDSLYRRRVCYNPSCKRENTLENNRRARKRFIALHGKDYFKKRALRREDKRVDPIYLYNIRNDVYSQRCRICRRKFKGGRWERYCGDGCRSMANHRYGMVEVYRLTL